MLLSRLLIDSISEMGFRSQFLSRFAHAQLEEQKKRYKSADEKRYTYDVSKEEKAKLRFGSAREWNVVYRAALRAASNDEEIKKRRSQGRIVRSLLFPISLASFAFIESFDQSCIVLSVIGGPLIGFVIVLFLYAYAELMIFAEATDISERSQGLETEESQLGHTQHDSSTEQEE